MAKKYTRWAGATLAMVALASVGAGFAFSEKPEKVSAYDASTGSGVIKTDFSSDVLPAGLQIPELAKPYVSVADGKMSVVANGEHDGLMALATTGTHTNFVMEYDYTYVGDLGASENIDWVGFVSFGVPENGAYASDFLYVLGGLALFNGNKVDGEEASYIEATELSVNPIVAGTTTHVTIKVVDDVTTISLSNGEASFSHTVANEITKSGYVSIPVSIDTSIEIDNFSFIDLDAYAGDYTLLNDCESSTL